VNLTNFLSFLWCKNPEKWPVEQLAAMTQYACRKIASMYLASSGKSPSSPWSMQMESIQRYRWPRALVMMIESRKLAGMDDWGIPCLMSDNLIPRFSSSIFVLYMQKCGDLPQGCERATYSAESPGFVSHRRTLPSVEVPTSIRRVGILLFSLALSTELHVGWVGFPSQVVTHWRIRSKCSLPPAVESVGRAI